MSKNMNEMEEHQDESESESSCSSKISYQAEDDSSIGLKIDSVYSLQSGVEDGDEEHPALGSKKSPPTPSLQEQYRSNMCKDFSIVLLQIDSYLTGRDRVHYRQWKRRFQRCGPICREMKVQQMMKAKRKEMRGREIWRLEQLNHIGRIKKLLDQEPDQLQNVGSKNFQAYLAGINSKKDKDLPSGKYLVPLGKMQYRLQHYNKDEASFYRNYTGLKYETVYENFKKMKKEKKTKTDHKAKKVKQEYCKSPNKDLPKSSMKISFNLQSKQNNTLEYGAKGNNGELVKKQIAAVAPTFNNILPLKDSTVKSGETKQEHAFNLNDLSQIEDLSKFMTSKDGKPLKYICTTINGRVALIPICENPSTDIKQNGSIETKPIPVNSKTTPTTTSSSLPMEKMIPASQIKVETGIKSEDTTLGNLKSSFASHPTGNAIVKTTVNAVPVPLGHQEMPKQISLASPVLNKKPAKDQNLSKTSSMSASFSNFSATPQTKNQITQGTGMVNTILIPANTVDNSAHSLLGQTLNTSLQNNQNIQTSGNVVLLSGNQVLLNSNGQIALQNNCIINIPGSTEQQSSPVPVKNKGIENQQVVTNTTAYSYSGSKTAFQILQERNAALKIPRHLQDKTKFEPAKFEPAKFEPPKYEPPKFEPPKVEPPKVEPIKVTTCTPSKPSGTNSNFTMVPMPNGKLYMLPQQFMSVTTPMNVSQNTPMSVGQTTQVLPSNNTLRSSTQTPMQLQNGLFYQPPPPPTIVTTPTQSTQPQLYQLPSGQLVMIQHQTPTVQTATVPASAPVFNVVQNQTTPLATSPFISLLQNPAGLTNSQNLQTLAGPVTEQTLTLQGTQTLASQLQSVQAASPNQYLISSGTQQQSPTLFQLPNGQLLMPVKNASDINSLHTVTQAGLSNTASTASLGITSSGKKMGGVTSSSPAAVGALGRSLLGTSNTSVSGTPAASKHLTLSSSETSASNRLKETVVKSSSPTPPNPNLRSKYVVYPSSALPTKKPHILSDLQFPISKLENVKQHSEQPKSIAERNPILSQQLVNQKPKPYKSILPRNLHIKQEIPDDDYYGTKPLKTMELNETRNTRKEVVTASGKAANPPVPVKCRSKRKRKEPSVYRIDPDDTSRVQTYLDISEVLQEKPEPPAPVRKKRKPEKVCRVDPDYDGDDNSFECLLESRSTSPDLDYSMFLVPKKPSVGDPRIMDSTVKEIGLRLPDHMMR